MRNDYYANLSAATATTVISEMLGRTVKFIRNIYAVMPDSIALADYDKYGTACWKDSNGIICVAEKYPHANPFAAIFHRVINRLCSDEGPESLLKSKESMRRVALLSGESPDDMSESDLRAFIMSCAHNGVNSRAIARNILRVAFHGTEMPDNLEVAVCNGLSAYRGKMIKAIIDGNDKKMMQKLAMETVSQYSGHLHVHLGAPEGPMRDMKYPDVNYVIDVKHVRDIAARIGMPAESMIEAGFLEAVKNPIVVIKDKIRTDTIAFVTFLASPQEKRDASGIASQGGRDSGSDGTQQAPILLPSALKTDAKLDKNSERQNIFQKNDHFLVVNMPSPETVMKNGSSRALSFGFMHVSSLARALAYKDRETGRVNMLHVRRAADNKYTSDIVTTLRQWCDTHEGPAAEEVLRVLPRLRDNVMEFRNPVNFEDVEKSLAKGAGSPLREAPAAARPANPFVDDGPLPDIDQTVARPAVFGSPAGIRSEVKRRPLQERLATAIRHGGFSKLAEKNLSAAGMACASDIKSFIANRGEEAFREKFGPKALRCANDWLSSLGLDTATYTQRQRISVNGAADDGHGLTVKDFFAALREFPKDTPAGSVAMPVGADGRPFTGADAYQLAARMANSPRWAGCNVFLDEKTMEAFGITPTPAAIAVYPVSKGGVPVYNLMDTSMYGGLKDRIRERLYEASPAVPTSMLRQLATYAPAEMQDAGRIAAHFDRSFAEMAKDVMAAGQKTDTFETAVMQETHSLEKKLDRYGYLRGYGFPEATLRKLFVSGTAPFHGEILTRRRRGTADEGHHIGTRRADVVLKLGEGGILMYTPADQRYSPIKEALTSGRSLAARTDEPALRNGISKDRTKHL